VIRWLLFAALLALSACSVAPFKTGSATTSTARQPAPTTGSGPEIKPTTGETVIEPEPEQVIEEPAPAVVEPPAPRPRPKRPPATLSPASEALVAQARAQRKKGDLPGASVALDRAMRIEPNNPLLWIEMGQLRMDQRNYPQAENMGRKALAMVITPPTRGAASAAFFKRFWNTCKSWSGSPAVSGSVSPSPGRP